MVAIGLFSWLFRAPVARADRPTQAPTWAFGSPSGEAVLGAASAASMLTLLLPQHTGEWYASSARPFSLYEDGLSYWTAGAGVLGVPLLTFAGDTQDYRRLGVASPARIAAPQLLSDVEAALFMTGLTFAIKRSVGRCRPHVSARPCGAFDSFPSGHTAPPSAVAASEVLLALRAPSPAHAASALLGESLTVLTAILRVRAGRHSWEDVTAGFAMGATVGALVALAHPMRPLDEPAPITVSGSF